MKQTILMIVLIVAVVATGYFVYRLFAGGRTADESAAGMIVNEQKLNEYRKIQTLKFDLSVFTDPFFKSLFSPFRVYGAGTTTAPAAKPGRPNPFSPF